MNIYHYSNKKGLKIISPDFFGENSYTFNDKKYNINRSFFYLKPVIPEYHLKHCKYLYIADIQEKRVYDLRTDKDKLKDNFNDITELLKHLKKYYLGFIYNVGFDIICLFNDIKVIEDK